MTQISVDSQLRQLVKELNSCTALPNDLRQYRRVVSGRSRGLPPSQFFQIGELACLRMFLAWESFLEETFLRYMCGAASGTGYTPIRFVTPRTIDHARDMVGAGKEYAAWSVAKTVIERAELYFDDGEPYRSALTPAILDLEDLRFIRNRVAHSSQKSQEQFRSVVRRKMGFVPRGLGPGRFVLSANTSGTTYLDYLGQVLANLAGNIVPTDAE